MSTGNSEGVLESTGGNPPPMAEGVAADQSQKRNLHLSDCPLGRAGLPKPQDSEICVNERNQNQVSTQGTS